MVGRNPGIPGLGATLVIDAQIALGYSPQLTVFAYFVAFAPLFKILGDPSYEVLFCRVVVCGRIADFDAFAS